jgi:mono/diheme cytochrome c family protein
VIGGPLDGAGLSASTVEERVRKGGDGMPAFGALSAHDVASVAAYVAAVSRR